MTSFNQRAWRGDPNAPDERPELLAWYAEQDALDGNLDVCICYDPTSMEYGPNHPCEFCKALELAAIDRDGHDDKRETGAA